jgi:hypothetical protein
MAAIAKALSRVSGTQVDIETPKTIAIFLWSRPERVVDRSQLWPRFERRIFLTAALFVRPLRIHGRSVA